MKFIRILFARAFCMNRRGKGPGSEIKLIKGFNFNVEMDFPDPLQEVYFQIKESKSYHDKKK